MPYAQTLLCQNFDASNAANVRFNKLLDEAKTIKTVGFVPYLLAPSDDHCTLLQKRQPPPKLICATKQRWAEQVIRTLSPLMVASSHLSRAVHGTSPKGSKVRNAQLPHATAKHLKRAALNHENKKALRGKACSS